MNQYESNVILLKAIADKTRLEILDMLSCGELCACNILEHFQITQPTLSHHMKILCDCALVLWRKESKWTYYSLNNEKLSELKDFLSLITEEKANCICQKECECD